MLAKKDEVQHLIPQKPPMIMVGGLLEHSDNSSISTIDIKSNNIFCEDGFFVEAGLIENMAQTAALRNGYQCSLENKEALIGYIGSLKRIKIYDLPKIGDNIKTKVGIITSLMNVQIIKAEVFCNSELMAEGEMNIFLQENH
jgi:predicted hotdog family 3-hydroxylacyl-ACP dehydratase